MERTYTMDELLSALRRRWKLMAVVAGAVFLVAAVFVARTPNEYRARALVMVEDTMPHSEMVVPIVTSTLEEKVRSVRAQVYARGLMATAIEELNLYPKARERGMDAAVEALRADTEVAPEGTTAFSIVVRGRDPAVAARTANRLAELFIEGNLQVRAGHVTRTREVVGAKLEELRAELAKSEQKVAAFRDQNRETVPEMAEARLAERGQIARQIEIEEGFVKDAQRRLDLIGTGPAAPGTEVARFEEEVDALRASAGAAAAALTPEHPDVQRVQRELASARARLEQARARAAADDLEERRLKEAIRRGRAQIARLEERVAQIDKLLAASPMVAAQLGELTRDVDMLRAKVTHLVSKKAEADITADLELKQAPAQFRVLESAVAPSFAASPNRAQGLLIGLLIALGLGAAVALFRELSDRSLRTEAEAGAELALPVLACVPQLPVTPAPSRGLLRNPFRAEA